MARLTYEDALDRIGRALQFGINPSLEPIREVLDLLGHPERSYAVIQVAGTNGKTSVARMCAAILTAHGLTVGHYLSPHLEEYTERFSVDGEGIGADAFAAALEAVLPATDEVARRRGQDLTEFELLTAMGLQYFADMSCNVAVLEVGLGGRWDATTACDPSVAVITTIGLDHCDRLGPDVASIATEKAEIIKPGARLVVGLVRGDALDVVSLKARAAGVPMRRLDHEIGLEPAEAPPGFVALSVATPQSEYPDLVLATDALYQQENAALAVAAAEWFLEGVGEGMPRPPAQAGLDPDRVRRALAELAFPGRMEQLSDCPTLILDGAHNPEAAAKLAGALRHAFAGRRIFMVLGIMADKDVAGIVDALVPLACCVICTKNWSSRSLDPESLAEIVRQAIVPGGGVPGGGVPGGGGEEPRAPRPAPAAAIPTEAVPDVRAACERAIALAGPDDVVVVTGSLYTAGEARTWWRGGGHLACPAP